MDQRAGSALYERIVFCPRIDMNSTKQALASMRRGKASLRYSEHNDILECELDLPCLDRM